MSVQAPQTPAAAAAAAPAAVPEGRGVTASEKMRKISYDLQRIHMGDVPELTLLDRTLFHADTWLEAMNFRVKSNTREEGLSVDSVETESKFIKGAIQDLTADIETDTDEMAGIREELQEKLTEMQTRELDRALSPEKQAEIRKRYAEHFKNPIEAFKTSELACESHFEDMAERLEYLETVTPLRQRLLDFLLREFPEYAPKK